jgi:2-dehydro-3-deoxygluconokinase
VGEPGYDAVTFGEVMALFLSADGLPLRSSTSFRRSIAGAEANVAIALSALGHRAAFAGRVGDDVMGDVVTERLRAAGLDAFITRDKAPTGLLIRDVAAHRPSQVVYARSGSAGSRLERGDLREMLDRGGRLLHLTGITAVISDRAGDAAEWAVQWARSNQALVVVDPNVRLRLAPRERYVQRVKPLMQAADVVIAGEDELRLLMGTHDARRAAAELVEGGADLVVAKRGGRGSWAFDGQHLWEQAASDTRVVDAVGAGDAFAAGIISALLRGVEPPQALREAAAVASCVVGTAGDVEGLPTASERDDLLRGNQEVRR